ncbi:hypothetical protein NMY22_g1457 [Coprinellus aureogranulatus]|nr:hypothetical protein NMY22_g1457 [Coprinellus aureogranulatus]
MNPFSDVPRLEFSLGSQAQSRSDYTPQSPHDALEVPITPLLFPSIPPSLPHVLPRLLAIDESIVPASYATPNSPTPRIQEFDMRESEGMATKSRSPDFDMLRRHIQRQFQMDARLVSGLISVVSSSSRSQSEIDTAASYPRSRLSTPCRNSRSHSK